MQISYARRRTLGAQDADLHLVAGILFLVLAFVFAETKL